MQARATQQYCVQSPCIEMRGINSFSMMASGRFGPRRPLRTLASGSTAASTTAPVRVQMSLFSRKYAVLATGFCSIAMP